MSWNTGNASISERVKSPVDTFNDLPTSGNTEADIRVVKDEDKAYTWNSSSSSGDLSDWVNLDDSATWSNITGKPSSSTSDIDDAVSKRHTQNTDTKLDEGGSNEVTAFDIREALDSEIPSKLDSSFVKVGVTKMLIHFNDGDGAVSNLTESSGYFTSGQLDATGEAEVDDAQKVFGVSSAKIIDTGGSFDRIRHNGAYLPLADHEDFTIDFRVRFSSIETRNNICSIRHNGSTSWQVYLEGGSLYFEATQDVSNPDDKRITVSNSWSPSINTWYHVEIVKHGNDYYMFIDGTQIGSTTTDTTTIDYSGENPAQSSSFVLGTPGNAFASWTTSDCLQGWIDEFRLVDRYAVNTSNFTSPSSEYSAETDVLIKLDSNGNLSKTSIAESDTSDAVSKKHSQNTDTALDQGGSNPISAANIVKSNIQFLIDGGGAEITTGVKGYIQIPFDCTIEEVRLLADQSGSIQVDIWKDTYANYPPTDADSITASAVPAISGATKSEDTSLTGWTTTINEGDVLGFNVDSITTIEKCTVVLKVKRT